MKFFGYYITTKEQWDHPEAFLTLRRVAAGQDRRVAVLWQSERLSNIVRWLEDSYSNRNENDKHD